MFMPFNYMGFGFGGCFGGGFYAPPCCCCNPFGFLPSFNPIISNMVIYNPFIMTNLCSVPSYNYNFQTSFNYQRPDISAFMPKMDFSQYTTQPTQTTTQNLSMNGFYDNLLSTISKNVLGSYQVQTTQITGQIKQEDDVTKTKKEGAVSGEASEGQRISLSASAKNKKWYEMTDAELKSIYGNYSRDITKKYTGSVDKLDKYLKGKGVLENKGQAFLDAQEKYGISASILIGICMNESGKGTSNLAKTKNNVGGVRIAGSNEFKKFSSVSECIDYMAKFLQNGYVNNSTRSLIKLYEINAKYCPVSDPSDIKQQNSGWASAVERYVSELEKVA